MHNKFMIWGHNTVFQHIVFLSQQISISIGNNQISAKLFWPRFQHSGEAKFIVVGAHAPIENWKTTITIKFSPLLHLKISYLLENCTTL